MRDYCVPDSTLGVRERAVLLYATNLLVGETDYEQILTVVSNKYSEETQKRITKYLLYSTGISCVSTA